MNNYLMVCGLFICAEPAVAVNGCNYKYLTELNKLLIALNFYIDLVGCVRYKAPELLPKPKNLTHPTILILNALMYYSLGYKDKLKDGLYQVRIKPVAQG